jgi:hypothetical protein
LYHGSSNPLDISIIMSITLQEISQQQLTQFEKQSILDHAVDLHLVGSDETDHAGFDLIEAKAEIVSNLFRVVSGNESVGLLYVLPFKNLQCHLEMTILIHASHRGQHITADAVSELEKVIKPEDGGVTLCATVREHNPLRHELTHFLLKHGYQYNSEHMAFMKKL